MGGIASSISARLRALDSCRARGEISFRFRAPRSTGNQSWFRKSVDLGFRDSVSGRELCNPLKYLSGG